jgi:hypothetical protein
MEMNIVEFNDGEFVNLYWMAYTESRRVFVEETGEEYIRMTFRFADGRGGEKHIRTNDAGLDMIREAMYNGSEVLPELQQQQGEESEEEGEAPEPGH